ncbi:MAG: sigma-70 family RNA polymerase sigma factor [Planctomycetes bacterium]|nr:sigma-70 family RNA polymerase sigma factor [Planctomycetota bacterium]
MNGRDPDQDRPNGRFPATRWSAVLGVRSADRLERGRAFERIAAAYWKPAYAYVRLRWRATDAEAEDLVQGFLTAAWEKELFARYEPGRAAFRTWFRLLLDGHVGNERKAARRQKRGGGIAPLSLDFASAESELRGREPVGEDQVEAFFDREWVRQLFALAVEDLRGAAASAGRGAAFLAFERFDLADEPGQRPSYAALAADLGVPVTTITNWLHQQRKQFRAAVLARLRELCMTDAEFREEARAILGSDACT